MTPKKFKGHNIVLAEGQPNYEPVPALMTQDANGTVITCWELSDEEIIDVCQKKELYIATHTFGSPFQPIFPTTKVEDIAVMESLDDYVERHVRHFMDYNNIPIDDLMVKDVTTFYRWMVHSGAYRFQPKEEPLINHTPTLDK